MDCDIKTILGESDFIIKIVSFSYTWKSSVLGYLIDGQYHLN